jgi:hypothetical protein
MSLRNYLDYFNKSIRRIDDYGFAESIEIIQEMRAAKQAVTKAKITLIDGSVFHIREYIDAKYKIEKISYAYQYQDMDGNLIFRYDNARHLSDAGFKEHKHLNDGSIEESPIPDISDVVDMVIEYIK